MGSSSPLIRDRAPWDSLLALSTRTCTGQTPWTSLAFGAHQTESLSCTELATNTRKYSRRKTLSGPQLSPLMMGNLAAIACIYSLSDMKMERSLLLTVKMLKKYLLLRLLISGHPLLRCTGKMLL
jgi:hypothetical protein